MKICELAAVGGRERGRRTRTKQKMQLTSSSLLSGPPSAERPSAPSDSTSSFDQLRQAKRSAAVACVEAGSSQSGSGREEEVEEERAKRLAAAAADDGDSIFRASSRREPYQFRCGARTGGTAQPHSNLLRCGMRWQRARDSALAPRKRARDCIGFFEFFSSFLSSKPDLTFRFFCFSLLFSLSLSSSARPRSLTRSLALPTQLRVFPRESQRGEGQTQHKARERGGKERK